MLSKTVHKSLRKIGRFISRNEKVLLAVLAVVIVISGGYWYRQFSSDGVGPTVGGTYIEGMVADKKELGLIVTKLTKSGLFSLDEAGNLQSQLVEHWESNVDKTEYTFDLYPEVDRQELITAIAGRPDLYSEVSAEANGDRQLILRLTEPNPSLPLLLARPVFDYGPYKLSKSNEQTSVFTRNTRQYATFAYLNKIVIHSYPNKEELEDALKRNRIDGGVTDNRSLTNKDFVDKTINLDRYYTVMFNLNRSPFRDDALRSAIINGQAIPGQSFTLLVPEQDPYKTLAENLVAEWRTRGAVVEISYKPLDEISQNLGPARDFQAVFIGIDYGADLDPYYIWHSSQLRPPGNNLTGVKNDTIDKLVDQTRTTLGLKERQALIEILHQEISNSAVAVIVKRESVGYYLSSKIRFVPPWVAANAADRFLAAPLWSIK